MKKNSYLNIKTTDKSSENQGHENSNRPQFLYIFILDNNYHQQKIILFNNLIDNAQFI